MKFSFLLVFAALFIAQISVAQENYKTISEEDNAKIYRGNGFYKVETIAEPTKNSKPKNVIFLIGDGMGLAQAYAGYTANGGQLYLQNFKKVGFATTYCKGKYVTDSAAAGTALASGKKTYYGAIGVDTDTVKIENIREKLEKQGLATGVVVTCAVTHATPAAFVAHQKSRGMYEEIAHDFANSNIDLFIGGGYKFFTDRKDGADLTKKLADKGYQIITEVEDIDNLKKGKVAGLLASEHMITYGEGRGDYLPKAVDKAIEILNTDKDGFFMMVEGSQIDWGGHQNNTTYIVNEVLDFDRTIGEVLKFAAKDKETLVIVTADHETGGFAVENGDFKTGNVTGDYTTGNHTGIMVPVYAFGPGSENFTGIMDNTDIPNRIMELMK